VQAPRPPSACRIGCRTSPVAQAHGRSWRTGVAAQRRIPRRTLHPAQRDGDTVGTASPEFHRWRAPCRGLEGPNCCGPDACSRKTKRLATAMSMVPTTAGLRAGRTASATFQPPLSRSCFGQKTGMPSLVQSARASNSDSSLTVMSSAGSRRALGKRLAFVGGLESGMGWLTSCDPGIAGSRWRRRKKLRIGGGPSCGLPNSRQNEDRHHSDDACYQDVGDSFRPERAVFGLVDLIRSIEGSVAPEAEAVGRRIDHAINFDYSPPFVPRKNRTLGADTWRNDDLAPATKPCWPGTLPRDQAEPGGQMSAELLGVADRGDHRGCGDRPHASGTAALERERPFT